MHQIHQVHQVIQHQRLFHHTYVIINDCPASNRSIEPCNPSACTSSNNTYCDSSVLYEFIRVMNKDGTDVSSFH